MQFQIIQRATSTHYYKDQLAAKLRIKPDDPGAWHLHADTTEDFAWKMFAVYADDHRFWRCPDGKAEKRGQICFPKRRLKPYQLLTKPRGEMIEIQHQSRYEKIA